MTDPSGDVKTRSDFIQRLRAIADRLRSGLVGRDKEIGYLLLALASRSNILLIGPPGTGKSMVVRMLADCLDLDAWPSQARAFQCVQKAVADKHGEDGNKVAAEMEDVHKLIFKREVAKYWSMGRKQEGYEEELRVLYRDKVEHKEEKDSNVKSDTLIGTLFPSVHFSYLMSRFTVPEELFGPFDIKKLANSEFERNVHHMLPEAAVAFLDEIFKANSAILNALLTIIEERKFRTGANEYQVPLLCVVGASNETPRDEELGALHDRFILRVFVPRLSQGEFEDEENLKASVDGSAVPVADKAALQEYVKQVSQNTLGANSQPEMNKEEKLRPLELMEHYDKALETVEVDPFIQQLFVAFRCEEKSVGVHISDRRIRYMIITTKVLAYIEGFDRVHFAHFAIVLRACWRDESGSERRALVTFLKEQWERLMKEAVNDKTKPDRLDLLLNVWDRAPLWDVHATINGGRVDGGGAKSGEGAAGKAFLEAFCTLRVASKGLDNEDEKKKFEEVLKKVGGGKLPDNFDKGHDLFAKVAFHLGGGKKEKNVREEVADWLSKCDGIFDKLKVKENVKKKIKEGNEPADQKCVVAIAENYGLPILLTTINGTKLYKPAKIGKPKPLHILMRYFDKKYVYNVVQVK